MTERIGLEAIFEDSQFRAGIQNYVKSVDQAASASEQAARQISSAWAGTGLEGRFDALRQRTAALKEDHGKLAQDIERDTEKVKTSWADTAKEIGTATTIMTAALTAVLTKVTLAAARNQELGIVLERVGQNIGKTADQMTAYEDSVKGMGITTQAARQALIQMVQAQINLSHATELARLAQDAAVIAQLNSSEAFERLITTIQRGSPLMARTLGIVVDFEGAYQRFAEANDRAVDSLTAAEKVEIRTANVLENSAQIAGTYEAAMGSAGKQLRSMSRYTEELSVELGQSLLPVMGAGVEAGTSMLKWLLDMDPALRNTIVQSLAFGTALLAVGKAATFTLPKLIAMVAGLGPLGIAGALLTAAAAVAIYQKNTEDAHIAESAALADSTESYRVYITALDDAGVASYGLTEALYDLIKAQKASAQAAYAEGLVRASTQLQKMAELHDKGRVSVEQFIEGLSWGGRELTDFDLIVLQDEKSLLLLGTALGMAGEELHAWVKEMRAAAEATFLARQATENYNEFERERYDILQQLMEAHRDYTSDQRDLRSEWGAGAETMAAYTSRVLRLTGGFQEMAQAALDADPAVAALTEELTKLIEKAEGDEGAALAYTFQTLAEIARNAEDELKQIADKADDDLEKAEADHLKKMEDLEKDHADRAAGIQTQIAETHAALLEDMAKAEAEFQQKRLDLQRQYAQEIEDAERDLAQDRADAQQDFYRDMADMERDHARDMEDAARELASDLADLQRDLADRNADTWADYYADLEDMAEEHGERMRSIEQKYADLRAGIEEKYRTDKTADELRDEEREALLKQLEELRRLQEEGMTGVDYSEAIAAILAQLDLLKQEELDALEAARQEEIAAEEAAYEEEQRRAEERRQEQLDANQAWYDEQAAQRQREYERELEDLRRALERERADREQAYAQQQADLETAHARHLDELARANQERLDALDEWLADERERLQDAEEERLKALGKQLAAEGQSFADRKDQLEDALDDEKQAIADRMDEQTATVEEKAKAATDAVIAAWQGIDPAVAAALRNTLDNTITPWVNAVIDEIRRMKEGIEAELQSSPVSGWFLSEGQSIVKGLEMGMAGLPKVLAGASGQIEQFVAGIGSPALATDLDGAIANFGRSLNTLALPMAVPTQYGPSTSTTHNHNLSVTANYSEVQSERSLVQDIGRLQMMMKLRTG